MDHLSFVSLILAGAIVLPSSIAIFVLSFKHKKDLKAFFIFVSILLVLFIGGIIPNGILGLICSTRVYFWNGERYIFVTYFRSDYSIVSFVLSINATVIGLIAFVASLTLKFQKSRTTTEQAVKALDVFSHNNSHYIEELKQLKELLDCGALTQQEFDAKKKVVLEGR